MLGEAKIQSLNIVAFFWSGGTKTWSSGLQLFAPPEQVICCRTVKPFLSKMEVSKKLGK